MSVVDLSSEVDDALEHHVAHAAAVGGSSADGSTGVSVEEELGALQQQIDGLDASIAKLQQRRRLLAARQRTLQEQLKLASRPRAPPAATFAAPSAWDADIARCKEQVFGILEPFRTCVCA